MVASPVHLVWTQTDNIAQFETLPPGLVDLNEQFVSDTGQFTKFTEGTPGTTAIVSGSYQISHSGSQNDIVTQNAAAIPVPQFWVESTINIVNTGGTGYDNGGVGIVKDANNYMFASCDRLGAGGTLRVRLQVKIAGTVTFLGTVNVANPLSFKLALSMVGTKAVVWYDVGGGWTVATIQDVVSYYDFRTIGNLTGWRYGFTTANGGGTSVWKYSNLRAGRFGRVGLRDITIVSNDNGSPYFPTPTSVLFLATTCDPSAACYQGVFQFDLVTKAITQKAVIFVQRSGKVLNDLAGHCTWYPNGNRRLLIGSWANGFGNVIQTQHKLFTSGDILVGTNVVTVDFITLPGQTGANPGAYDAMSAYDAAHSRYIIAYALTENTNFSGNPFYAAACYTTDFTTFTLIGKDNANQGYEGTKLTYYRGQFFIMAGGPAGSGNSSRVYDATMTYVGALNIVFSGGADTQPHPMSFPFGTRQKLISFDNSRYAGIQFTWGNVRLYDALNLDPQIRPSRRPFVGGRAGL